MCIRDRGERPVGQLQGVGNPLEELVDLAPIGDQDGIEAWFVIVHQMNLPDMPSDRNPSEVLYHNIRGRGKPGKWIGPLHSAKQAQSHLQGCLGR
eukprot:8183816-Prorocentrum_lima.AAC.1